VAVIHAIGAPVNDGERLVLGLLKDGLDDAWHVVANFWIQQGTRSYECDALVVSPLGWAYVTEVKAWLGRIRGNDAQWEIPSLTGEGFIYPPNPVELTHRKGQILADILRREDPPLKAVFVQPLVVVVSETQPELVGRCAANTVLSSAVVERVQVDPREYKRRVPSDVGERVADVLVRSHRPIAPFTVVGSWQLLEQAEVGPRWEVWSARSGFAGSHGKIVRLKRFTLDPLAVGETARLQLQQARRDLESLERLAGAEGAVPLVHAVEEIDNSLIVVTEWPQGESLASLLAGGELSPHLAEEAFVAVAKALASVHREGVVHRNITPRCAHLLDDGRVVLTDFDYARIPDLESGITNVIHEELDVEFTAPEVRADPRKAGKSSDVWSLAQMGLVLFGLGHEGDKPEIAHVPARWHSAFEQALNDDPETRTKDAELFYKQLLGEGEIADELFDGFEANDEIEDRFVVRSDRVGEGGIARVYRVYDAISERDYAAKFVKRDYESLLDPAEEYRLLWTLPDHALIVKPEFVMQMTHFRRNGQVYSYRTIFVVTRWVDGTRLDQLIGQRLPPVRSVELALDIAQAAAHLHRNGLVHRDLKPQNVIVSEGKPRVVDFNVSGRMEAVGHTETGTKPYRPPDLPQVGWGPDADAYAVCVILAELLAGRRLGEGVREWIAEAVGLGPTLRAVLDRGTAASKDTRWTDAAELGAALASVVDELRRPIETVPEATFPQAAQDELERADWNPYQHRLVGLFSQSSTSNIGTRGLDEFARWAYIETRIDRDLFIDIAQGVPRLVVITGNAGDGKTAFIQMVESRLADQGATVEPRPLGNGSTIVHGDLRLVTNLDGSQDEGDRENDGVLREFFRPFAGESPAPEATETRVIAINEGRLRDFLSEHRQEFPWLERTTRSLLLGEAVAGGEWLRLVNLNLRALTKQGEDGQPIVSKLLSRFSDQRLWQPCAGCRAIAHCYAHANAAVLRDPVLGPRAAERIRQTLDLVRLRRRLHITMRDLRSALAFVVVGNRTCDEIVRLVEENDSRGLLSGHLYNAIFAASEKLDRPGRSDDAARDRLLALVGTLDVAKTADPQDDARLWMGGADAVAGDPPSLARNDRQLIAEIRERLPLSPSELEQARAQADLRLVQASLRRKLFLEREDPGWLAMFPYARLADFLRLLREGCRESDHADVIRAVSNSDGLFSDEFGEYLSVRLVAESESADRSFVLHPAEEFVLGLRDESGSAMYVEYAPDGLRLESTRLPGVRLDIDLDLYETLMRVRRGFTPSREELRGAWLNLRIFKEQLASAPSDSLLLSRDDRRFFRVTRVSGEHAIDVEAVSLA
jgi:serine/threonine protein kinase